MHRLSRRAFITAAAIAAVSSTTGAVARQSPVKPADDKRPGSGEGSVEWEGFAFDVTDPVTAYVVERVDTLSGARVSIVLFIDGYDPVGPVETAATGPFATAVVGDAFQLGVDGVVNDGA